MLGLLEQYQKEHEVPAIEIAAALAQLSIGDKPLLMTPDPERSRKSEGRPAREERGPTRRERQSREDSEAARRDAEGGKPGKGKQRRNAPPASDMERFRIEVGYAHGVKPGNIVGAIANEAGLDGKHVGQVEITDTYSFVDLPKGMPKEVFRDLKKVWVCGQQLKISRLGSRSEGGAAQSAPARFSADTGANGKVHGKAKGKGDGKHKRAAAESSAPRQTEPGTQSESKSPRERTGSSATSTVRSRPKHTSGGKGKPKAKSAAPKAKARHRDAKAKGKPGAGKRAGKKPT
jgi:ATP-dependent RNA helicase DeaD